MPLTKADHRAACANQEHRAWGVLHCACWPCGTFLLMKKTLNEQGRRPQVQPSESPPVLYEKWPLDLWSAAPIIRRRQWHPTPVPLPGKSHGRRSLVGCSPWGHEELDTTEWLHFHFLLSCIGEGNGNPLQCSCLENPRDGGAWWAAVYGVTQSRTWLKRLSSSSSSKGMSG